MAQSDGDEILAVVRAVPVEQQLAVRKVRVACGQVPAAEGPSQGEMKGHLVARSEVVGGAVKIGDACRTAQVPGVAPVPAGAPGKSDSRGTAFAVPAREQRLIVSGQAKKIGRVPMIAEGEYLGMGGSMKAPAGLDRQHVGAGRLRVEKKEETEDKTAHPAQEKRNGPERIVDRRRRHATMPAWP